MAFKPESIREFRLELLLQNLDTLDAKELYKNGYPLSAIITRVSGSNTESTRRVVLQYLDGIEPIQKRMYYKPAQSKSKIKKAKKSPSQKDSPELDARVKDLYYQIPRLRFSQIAFQVKLSEPRLAGIIRRLLQSGEIPHRRDSNNLQPQLSLPKRLKIITNMRNKGSTWVQIGKKLGISGQRVHQLISKHLPNLIKLRSK